MDDDDDKIRRNLVAVSSLLLLGAWLEVTSADVIKRVFGEGFGGQVSTGRLWLAVIVVLTYLALRYKFHPLTLKASTHFGAAFMENWGRWLQALLVRECRVMEQGGARRVRHLQPEFVNAYKDKCVKYPSHSLTVNSIGFMSGADAEGRLSASLSPRSDPDNHIASIQGAFRISLLYAVPIAIASAFRAASYSEGLHYVAPWVMFTFAYFLAFFRWASTWDWWLTLWGVN